jgi:hypothetical protein
MESPHTDENALVARTRTGEDGSYRVRAGSLAEGTYRVRFSADRWWEDALWSTATDVAISTGQSTRLDAALVPAMTRVFGETSCCGGPSPDVRVDAFHADTGALVATTHSVESLDCTGCYELVLPAGDIYTFRASFPSWSTAWFWQPGGPAGGFGLELPPGEQEVSLVLTHEALFSGRVVDTAGTPIAGARVLAVPSRTPVPPQLEEATTGADERSSWEGSGRGSTTSCSSSDPTAPGRLPAWCTATLPPERSSSSTPPGWIPSIPSGTSRSAVPEAGATARRGGPASVTEDR